MAPRKKKETKKAFKPDINAYIAGAGLTVEQPITETLETNYAICYECYCVSCNSRN